ncbi:ASCH domain-containing protein [Nitrospira sp. Nam74]
MVRYKQSGESPTIPLRRFSANGESVIVFLPVKPVYANLILSGGKRYEFRRSRFRHNVTHLVLYSTSPVKRIVGVARVNNVSVGSLSGTWRLARGRAGIPRKVFNEYYAGTEVAVALSLSYVKKLAKELQPAQIRDGFRVPQSFSYVDTNFYKQVLNEGFPATSTNP